MEIKTYERIKKIIDKTMEKIAEIEEMWDEGYFYTHKEYYDSIDHVKAEAFDEIIGLG